MAPHYDSDDDDEDDLGDWTATPSVAQEELLQLAWQRLQIRRERLKKHWMFQERQRTRFLDFFLENTGDEFELTREDRDLIRDSNGKYRTFIEMRELLEGDIDEAAEGLQHLSKAIETEGVRTERGNSLVLQLVQAERMATQALKDGYQKFDLELSRMQQMLLMALERAAAAHRRFEESQAQTKEAQREVRELQSQWADVSEVLKALARFSRQEVQQAINQTKGKRPVERAVLEDFYQGMDERAEFLTEEKSKWKRESDQALVLKEKLVGELQAELATTRRLWQEAVDDAISCRAGMQITKTKAAEYIARHMALLNGHGGLASDATSRRRSTVSEVAEDPEFKIQPWAPVQCATKGCQTDPPPVPPTPKSSAPNSPHSRPQRLLSPTSAHQSDGLASPRAGRTPRITDLLGQQTPASPRSQGLLPEASPRSAEASQPAAPATLPSGDVPQLSVPPKSRPKPGKAGKATAARPDPANQEAPGSKSGRRQSPLKKSKSRGSLAPPGSAAGGAEGPGDAAAAPDPAAGAAAESPAADPSQQPSPRPGSPQSLSGVETELGSPLEGRQSSHFAKEDEAGAEAGESTAEDGDGRPKGFARFLRRTSSASSLKEIANMKFWGMQSSEALGVLRFVIFKFDATIREGLKSGWHGVDPAVGFIREEELLRAVPLAKPVRQEIRVLNDAFKTLVSYLTETSRYVDETRVRMDALKKELDEDPRFKQVEMVKQKVLELKSQQEANEQAARHRYERLQAMFREQAAELAQLRSAAATSPRHRATAGPPWTGGPLEGSLQPEDAAAASLEAAHYGEAAAAAAGYGGEGAAAGEGPWRTQGAAGAFAAVVGGMLEPPRMPSASAAQRLYSRPNSVLHGRGGPAVADGGGGPGSATQLTGAKFASSAARDAPWAGALANLEVGWKPLQPEQQRPSNVLPSLVEPLDARRPSVFPAPPRNHRKTSKAEGGRPSNATALPDMSAVSFGQALTRPTTPIAPFTDHPSAPLRPPGDRPRSPHPQPDQPPPSREGGPRGPSNRSKLPSRCPSPEYYATAGFRLLAIKHLLRQIPTNPDNTFWASGEGGSTNPNKSQQIPNFFLQWEINLRKRGVF